MAFRTADFSRLVRFNSANSCDFLELCESAWDKKIAEDDAKPKSRTIAPSSAYCMKQNWFRLRGVEPDKPKTSDRGLDFTAQVGTSCHENLQSLLKATLKDDWLDVGEFIRTNCTWYSDCEIEQHGLETRIAISNPPIRFACDGLIRWKGEIYLLEIKTSEFSSWDSLTAPKPIHIDQVKSYASLLHVNHVLMIYQDRQYGGLKCFELRISDEEIKATWDTFYYIVDMADKNLPTKGLPSGDSRCSASMCPYHKKCKEW